MHLHYRVRKLHVSRAIRNGLFKYNTALEYYVYSKLDRNFSTKVQQSFRQSYIVSQADGYIDHLL